MDFKKIHFIGYFTFFMLLYFFCIPQESTNNAYLVSLVGRQWKDNTKIFHQPNGPFAFMVFDDQYPVGGVIYYDLMGSPIDEGWKINERFWQEKEWASDITSFVWHPNGKYLYISTANVYGVAGFFNLDLRKRIYSKLVSQEELIKESPFKYPTISVVIADFDPRTLKATLSIEFEGSLSSDSNATRKVIKKVVHLE